MVNRPESCQKIIFQVKEIEFLRSQRFIISRGRQRGEGALQT